MSARNDELNDKMSLRNSIAEKAEHSSPEKPADYTLEETLAIIEAGLGKNAAGVFRASAQEQPRLTMKDVQMITAVASQTASKVVQERPASPDLSDDIFTDRAYWGVLLEQLHRIFQEYGNNEIYAFLMDRFKSEIKEHSEYARNMGMMQFMKSIGIWTPFSYLSPPECDPYEPIVRKLPRPEQSRACLPFVTPVK
jgi:hypothetical protein